MTRWIWYLNISIAAGAIFVLIIGLSQLAAYSPQSTIENHLKPEKDNGKQNQGQGNPLSQENESPLITAIREFSQRWEPPVGSVSITIMPKEAADEIKWRINKSQWQKSGAKVNNVGLGKQEIEFLSHPVWSDQQNISVEVAKRKTTEQTVTFSKRPPPEYGSLKVIISPQEVIELGAEWQVDKSPWQKSGNTLDKALVGSRQVEFKSIAGWSSPVGIKAAIIKDALTETVATYAKIPPPEYGSLSVVINPAEAVKADAQWRVNEAQWNKSSAAAEKIVTGTYNVNFSAISGWTSPNPISVNITKDKTERITAKYTRPKPPAPTFELSGTIVLGKNDGIAWVKLPQAKDNQIYFIGNVVDNYTLQSVTDGAIVVTREGYEYKVEVSKEKTQPLPPVSPQATPPVPQRSIGQRERPDRKELIDRIKNSQNQDIQKQNTQK